MKSVELPQVFFFPLEFNMYALMTFDFRDNLFFLTKLEILYRKKCNHLNEL